MLQTFAMALHHPVLYRFRRLRGLNDRNASVSLTSLTYIKKQVLCEGLKYHKNIRTSQKHPLRGSCCTCPATTPPKALFNIAKARGDNDTAAASCVLKICLRSAKGIPAWWSTWGQSGDLWCWSCRQYFFRNWLHWVDMAWHFLLVFNATCHIVDLLQM